MQEIILKLEDDLSEREREKDFIQSHLLPNDHQLQSRRFFGEGKLLMRVDFFEK